MERFAVAHSLTESQIKEADIQEVPVYIDSQYPSYFVYCLGKDDKSKIKHETPELAYESFLAATF